MQVDDLTDILGDWTSTPPPCEVLYISTKKFCLKPSAARVILLCPENCRFALFICGLHLGQINQQKIQCRICGQYATGYLET